LENKEKQIFSEQFANYTLKEIIELSRRIIKYKNRPEFRQLMTDINHIHNYNDQQIRDKLSIKIDDIKIENFYTKYKFNIAMLQYHLHLKTGGKSRRLKKKKAKTRKYKGGKCSKEYQDHLKWVETEIFTNGLLNKHSMTIEDYNKIIRSKIKKTNDGKCDLYNKLMTRIINRYVELHKQNTTGENNDIITRLEVLIDDLDLRERMLEKLNH
jgi:hypothetical protein